MKTSNFLRFYREQEKAYLIYWLTKLERGESIKDEIETRLNYLKEVDGNGDGNAV